MKKEFDEVFEKGAKNYCPSCGVGGTKDDECTHMTCPNCHTVWCYVCEKKESEVDKSPDQVDDIYAHNADWKTNPKRCPMYLTEIEDVDDRWPGDETNALELFHRLKLLRVLKEFVTKIGLLEFEKLKEVFPSVANCGMTQKEIMETDNTLIYRKKEVN